MRTAGPCVWCGRTTTSSSRVCPLCIYTERHRDHDPRDGLRGGYWAPRGAVQVWVRA